MDNLLFLQARAPPGQEAQNLPSAYDSQHETERKRQLLKLFNRTQEQVHLQQFVFLCYSGSLGLAIYLLSHFNVTCDVLDEYFRHTAK